MRILYFSRDYSTHDHRFLTELSRTEHKIFYLRLERRGHTLEERPLPSQIKVVPWAGGQKPANSRDGLRLLRSMKSVVQRIQPDLIQAGPLQTCAFLTALSRFQPLVSTSWGSDLLVDADRSPWMRGVTKYVLRHSSVLVGDCNAVRQKAISFGFPPERIITFPWGIDLAHFRVEAGAAHQEGVFTVLSTRSWEPIYGVDVIAQAFVLAGQSLKQRPETRGLRFQLVMLGGGSQSQLIQSVFTQAGVQTEVKFPGQVSQADLPDYYRRADLYVSASHSDGTSISLLEAMACGCPVVVSDIPGNREWVTPGEHGWLFPDGDPEALARGLVNAVSQRVSLPVMGQAGRRLAEERADWQMNFQQLLQAYDLAVKG